MAIRRVIRMGHPLLRQPARPLEPEEIGSEPDNRLIADMVDTLHDYGGIGLAAPQIAEPVRLAIIEMDGEPTRYGELDPIPLTVFINPVIEVVDPATAGFWEGCLSVPGLRGFVERPQHVKVQLYDRSRVRPRNWSCRDFHATVFQHEFDHLDGKLFIDRLKDSRLLVFEEEFEKYMLPKEEEEEED